MLAGVDDLLAVVVSVYGAQQPPREFRLLQAVRDVQREHDPKALVGSLKTTAHHLRAISETADSVQAIFKTTLTKAAAEKPIRRARRSLGQMLVGDLAEREFERLRLERALHGLAVILEAGDI